MCIINVCKHILKIGSLNDYGIAVSYVFTGCKPFPPPVFYLYSMVYYLFCQLDQGFMTNAMMSRYVVPMLSRDVHSVLKKSAFQRRIKIEHPSPGSSQRIHIFNRFNRRPRQGSPHVSRHPLRGRRISLIGLREDHRIHELILEVGMVCKLYILDSPRDPLPIGPSGG